MNYHDARSPNTSSHNPRAGPSRRPATISELAERASIPWDNSKGLKYHLKLAEKYQLEGKKYARSGDMENAFVELAKAATLVLESLPEHPDYNAKLNANQRHNLGLSAQEILDNLNELKPGIVDRYENWCQAQLDGVDGDITLNVPTQQLANNGQEILDNLDELSPGILDRCEKWCQAQLDGYTTPNVPTQQLENNGQEILDNVVDELDPGVLDRYEKWLPGWYRRVVSK